MATVKNKIVLTGANAKWLCKVGLSASSRDDRTPVICSAKITVDGDSARVTSTDRYRVHMAAVKLESNAKPHEFLFPNVAMTWLDRNAAIHGRLLEESNRIIITTTDEFDLTIEVRETDKSDSDAVIWRGKSVKGGFPPVERLFDEARAAEPVPVPAAINLDFIAKSRGLQPNRWALPPRFKFTPTENPNKPGPLYLAFPGSDGSPDPVAEALIQPHLLFR